MLSVIGTALICSSVLGFGFYYVSSFNREKECLSELLTLFKRIKTRIECFKQPLSDIYADFSSPALDRIGFNTDLKESSLDFVLSKHRKSLQIRDSIFTILHEFASSLGKSYASEQIDLCRTYISRLEDELSEIEKDLNTKTKPGLTLSAAIASVCAIMLL